MWNVLLQKSSCFQLLPLRHVTFHKVVWRHTWGLVGSLAIVLLQIFSWFWQWNSFDNRLIFGKVKAYKNGAICSRSSLVWWIQWCNRHICHVTGSDPVTCLSVCTSVRDKNFQQTWCKNFITAHPACLSHHILILRSSAQGQGHVDNS